MSDPKTRLACALFVGGPWDGRREELQLVDRIRVPELVGPVRPQELFVPEPGSFKAVEYRLHVFGSKTVRYFVYAESSLTPDEVMGLMWDRYTPPG